jgi:hypothetical protein
MNATVCLYKRVLNYPMEGSINAMRADKNINVPVVMVRDEVAAVLSLMNGTVQLVATLRYGSSLRIMEGIPTRVKDSDVQIKPLPVCSARATRTGSPPPLPRLPLRSRTTRPGPDPASAGLGAGE